MGARFSAMVLRSLMLPGVLLLLRAHGTGATLAQASVVFSVPSGTSAGAIAAGPELVGQ